MDRPEVLMPFECSHYLFEAVPESMGNDWRAGLTGLARCDSKPVFKGMLEGLMWNPTTRPQHSRPRLRYGSDVTDAEWELLAPLLPSEATCGRRRAWSMRGVINAIFCVLRIDWPWQMPPVGFPPYTPVYRGFARLRVDFKSHVQRQPLYLNAVLTWRKLRHSKDLSSRRHLYEEDRSVERMFTRTPFQQPEQSEEGERGRVAESGTLTLPEPLWTEAKRRTAVIAPLAFADLVPFTVARAAGETRGLPERTVYALVRRYRHSGGLLASLAPQPSPGGRGRTRLSRLSEQIIGEAIRDEYLAQQKKRADAVVGAVRERACVAWIAPPSPNTVRA